MSNADTAETPPGFDRRMVLPVVVVAAGIMATTLGQTDVLARLPLANLLKNELHASRSANAAFFFWVGLAWYFKPLAGVLTDAFPVFGSRRRTYLLIAATLAAAGWIGLIFTPHRYGALLLVCIVINLFMMTASTVIGGFMVETAQASGSSGRLTAVRQFVQQASVLVAGPTAGVLAAMAFGWTPLACGGIVALLIPTALFALRERRSTAPSGPVLARAGGQLKALIGAPGLWGAAGLIGLFYVAPGIGTALFYKQQNDLHMTTQAQGLLTLLAAGSGIAAAVSYGFLCRRLSLRSLLLIALGLSAAWTFAYLFYSSVLHAQVIETVNGFLANLAELTLMDLAIRATPAGSEGLGYSVMLSVRNFALFGTDWLGSSLIDHFHFSFNSLVVANALFTMVTLPLIFLLPTVLVRGREAQTGLSPVPETAIQT